MTKKTTTEMDSDNNFSYCRLPETPLRSFAPDVTLNRMRSLMPVLKKWLNKTVLHYYFFDKPTDGQDVNGQWVTWTTTEDQKKVVRAAFKVWKDVGIGLEFKEVSNREDAEIRIGFMLGDGSWSYIGTDILRQGKQQRTMNFGWNLTSNIDTAIHEIGHTLGFEHEHQNPKSGIVWNDDEVYKYFAASPNYWTRESTYWNIIRKIDADTIQGSVWDSNSVMHYRFKSGLIKSPPPFQNGVFPQGGLSARDREWIRFFYPPTTTPPPPDPSKPTTGYTVLEPAKSFLLKLKNGQQQDFQLQPTSNRDYELRTFGKCDTLFVLYEESNGELRRLGGDDDSGDNRNAYMKLRLFRDRKYILRVRVNYIEEGAAVIMWW